MLNQEQFISNLKNFSGAGYGSVMYRSYEQFIEMYEDALYNGYLGFITEFNNRHNGNVSLMMYDVISIDYSVIFEDEIHKAFNTILDRDDHSLNELLMYGNYIGNVVRYMLERMRVKVILED